MTTYAHAYYGREVGDLIRTAAQEADRLRAQVRAVSLECCRWRRIAAERAEECEELRARLERREAAAGR